MTGASTSDEVADIASSVDRWAAHHYGPGATVSGLSRMPGHSGFTYAFDVEHDDGHDSLVLRVPPRGVRLANNLDLLRLVPAITLADRAGVPVPSVRWAGVDERWFGTPYLVVDRVGGAPLPDIFDPSAGPFPGPDAVGDIFRQAMSALAGIHSADATPLLEDGWAVPVDARDDIDQWTPMLHKSERSEEVAQTLELRDVLLRTAPKDSTTTLVHGDFYSNNWMLESGRLTAVLDWENTTLNRPMWDLGWIATIYDPRCWAPARSRTMDWNPTPHQIYDWYAAASDRDLVDPDWYHALMCYRLASITPSKVRLHRTGRRVDPVWELFADSIPFQLDTAFALLAGR